MRESPRFAGAELNIGSACPLGGRLFLAEGGFVGYRKRPAHPDGAGGESVDGTGSGFNLAELSLGLFISARPDEEFDVNFFAFGDPGVLMAEVGNLSEKIVPGVVWTEDYQIVPRVDFHCPAACRFHFLLDFSRQPCLIAWDNPALELLTRLTTDKLRAVPVTPGTPGPPQRKFRTKSPRTPEVEGG
jgi:hypothetical protein